MFSTSSKPPPPNTAMDSATVRYEIYDATIVCRQSLQDCQSLDPLARNGWAENRLADFDLWAAGVGAAVKHQASLDQRLQFRPKVHLVLTGLLSNLASIIAQCRELAVSAQNGANCESPDLQPEEDTPTIVQGDSSLESASAWFRSLPPDSGDDSSESESEDETQEDGESLLHSAMKGVETALDQLLRLGHAIRKSGTTTRLQKADRSFQECDYKDFQVYLAILLKRNTSAQRRDSTATADSRMLECKQAYNELSLEQQHLIFANLRRRHRFVYARRHQIKLAEPRSFTLASQSVDERRNANEMTKNSWSNRNPMAETQSEVSKGKQLEIRATLKTQATDSAMTVTTASGIEGDILKEAPPSQAASRVSITATKLDYPLPPPPLEGVRGFKCPCCYQTLPVMFLERSRWKKHLSEDLRPYTCPFFDCSVAQVLYTTRSQWADHIHKHHASSQSWECLACSDGEDPQIFLGADTFVAHLQIRHSDTIAKDQIPNLVEICSKINPPKFGSCPLCSLSSQAPDELPLDASAFLDHIGDCIHDFSLKALPWAESKGRDHSTTNNQDFKKRLDNDIGSWCDAVEISETMESCDFNAELRFINIGAEPSSVPYMEFVASEYFAEGQEHTSEAGHRSSRDTSLSDSRVNSGKSEDMRNDGDMKSGSKKPTYHQILDYLKNNDRSVSSWEDGLELEDCYGHIAELAYTQLGAIFLGKKMSTATDYEKGRVIEEIKLDAIDLMTDLTGGLLIKTLFVSANQLHKEVLANMMKGKVAELSMHQYGYLVVREALRSLPADEAAQLVKELEFAPVSMMTNEYGSRVIQSIIGLGRFPSFITDFARENARSIVSDRFGSGVLVELLEAGPREYTTALSEELLADAKESIFYNEHSHEILWVILQNEPSKDWLQLRNLVLDDFLSFATHEYAIEAVKTIVCLWPRNEWSILVRHLQTREDLLADLLTDANGIRVVYYLLSVLNGDDYENLVSYMRPLFTSLKDSKGFPTDTRVLFLVREIEGLIGRR
ncbi:armadillo-type protein [Cladorrhinum sp. PSN332]|nr:armadillo-type protein [Cladorrhinum sp. PSN332]